MNKTNSLALIYPQVSIYWDSKKNSLSPIDVSQGSSKTYWWKCPKCIAHHSFEMSIHNRRGKERICPYCVGKKVNHTNSLAVLAPNIALLWHPKDNGELNPTMVTRFSNKARFFICSQKHKFESRIADLTKGICPVCTGKQFNSMVSLAKIKPEIAIQWDFTKNEKMPTQIYFNSSEKYWWFCPFGHSFNAPANTRSNVYSGCKECIDESHTSIIEQALYYYIKLIFPDAINGCSYVVINEEGNEEVIELDIFIPSINLALEYDGYFHRFCKERDERKNKLCKGVITLIRVREQDLPILNPASDYVLHHVYSNNFSEINSLILKVISKLQTIHTFKFDFNLIRYEQDQNTILNSYVKQRKENSLLNNFPELVKEWHPKKNKGLKPEMFKPYSSRRVWWCCKDFPHHEWEASIGNRTKLNQGCPFCSNQKISKSSCLSFRFPQIIKYWHPIANSKLTPNEVFPFSKEKVFWICQNKHKHLMSISKKVNNPTSCPYCNGKKVNNENSLSSLNPVLVREWHPTLNGDFMPNEVTTGSKKKVFWQCTSYPKHVWEASVQKRVNGRKCPYCSKKKVLPFESLAAKRPDLILQWHPSNNTLPNQVGEKSNLIVRWYCINNSNHEWSAQISSRNKVTCPECQNKKVTHRNCLSFTHPDVAIKWHKSRNSFSPDKVVAGSGKKAWFYSNYHHETYETIRQFVIQISRK